MPAHRSARELDAIAFAIDTHESEVAGAAADVADQHNLPIEQFFVRARQVAGDPGVKGRGWLFEQGKLFNARPPAPLALSARALLHRSWREQ